MVAKHRIAYRPGHPDHRMTECVGDREAQATHRLLEGRMIDTLGVMQRPVHVEDDGTECVLAGSSNDNRRTVREPEQAA